MSRSEFDGRLDRIEKLRSVVRHELQRQPDPHQSEHAEDRSYDPGFGYLEIALVGVLSIWLMLDFWAALPYFLGCIAILIVLHVLRLGYHLIFGSPNRRRHAAGDLLGHAFDILTFR